MQVLSEKLRAPELRVDTWLNSEPLTMAGLRGRVVLVDFWDYTCINCLHTLPYIKEWHTRYANAGLTIIGIHAPEFEFAKQANHVAKAVQEYGLQYPVALDNGFKTWNGFANRAWPAKYLIDQDGYIRAFHHCEGEYQTFERLIQQLLKERTPAQSFPEPMPPVRELDVPGAACYRPTPELYLGYSRGELGNREGNPADQAVDYSLPPEERLLDTIYLQGPWLNRKEYIESVGNQPTLIHVDYRAAEVNLVVDTLAGEPVTLRLWLDGQPLPESDFGADVAQVEGHSVIVVDTARMVRLIRHGDLEAHRLTLSVSQAGLRAYAFTFVGCVAA